MRRLMGLSRLILVGLFVAGCGADGPPIQPSMSASVGVGTSGVHGSTNVRATRGNMSLGVGLGL